MTDKEKLNAIRAEVQNYIDAAHKAHTNITEGNFAHLLSFIDSLQEEPVNKGYTFKSIPRLLDMIQPSDRAKAYVAKLADSLDEQGYHTDAKIVRESIKIMNGEKVAMATMDEEPVSDDLLIAARRASCDKPDTPIEFLCERPYNPVEEEKFIEGANWQKNNLWKPADGDDLPDIDREVIAILDYDFGHYKVVYAHRPNPNGWNGTNIDTEEKEHFEPVIYDKGGWNQPHVLYWLDTKLPYEENKIIK